MGSDQFIAWPDSAKAQILYKWPEHNIRLLSVVTVEPDERALFIKQGKIVGYLPPGQHRLDGADIPFLGSLIDQASGGNFLLSELYFVSTREFTALKFGGPIDNVQDPKTTLVVGLQVFGEYSLKVVDPGKLIITMVGTQQLTNNTSITGWVREQLLKSLRASVIGHIVRGDWPVIGIAAYTDAIEQEVKGKALEYLAPYGLAIGQLGNFNVQLKPSDELALKNLVGLKAQKDQLAGGDFTKLAAGRAMIGAGEGMAKGGEGRAGAVGTFLGVGLGASLSQQVTAGESAMPTTSPALTVCPTCHAENAHNAKFCIACGKPLSPPQNTFCLACGASLPDGAKFCSSCGHQQGD